MTFPAPPADWYRTFFIAPFNELWDRVIPPQATAREAQFLLAQLEVNPGSKILDVPCGSGRISAALAAAGHDVTGVDLSVDALERARARMSAAGVTVTLRHCDMRELPHAHSFDAAVCLGNSFGYLPHAGTLDFLGALAGSLRPGARAAIHTGVCAESILTSVKPEETYDFGDMQFAIRNRYDVQFSRLETEFILTHGDQVWRQYGSQYVYTAAELVRMLGVAGLDVMALLSGVEGKPYALGEGELYLVAQTPTR
ncbi:MAG TPA: methyltransferase domain-containing protein [Steroidobacteraceae bacterium]|nr:methyltransferase domain-containing protein [Steroidobacteraceae bacterium]